MGHSVRYLMTAFVAGASVLTTAAHASAAQPQYATYRIDFVDSNVHSYRAGAVEANLRIRTSPDGIVSGYYQYDGSGPLRPIQGSRDGDRINLITSGGEVLTLSGRFDHDKIVGDGYLGNREVEFVANPSSDF